MDSPLGIIRKSLELVAAHPQLTIPYVVALAVNVVLFAVYSALHMSDLFVMSATAVLALVSIITWFICMNWSMLSISYAVRKKMVRIQKNFEESFNYLLKFCIIMCSYIFFVLLGYTGFLYSLSYDTFTGGAVLILALIGGIVFLLYFSLAKVALFFHNYSVVGCFKKSAQILRPFRSEFIVLLLLLLGVFVILGLLTLVVYFLTPFAYVVAGIFLLLFLLFTDVALVVFYRTYLLKHH